MNKATQSIVIAFAILTLPACAPPVAEKSALPLEIQAIQKRDFETTKKIAFGSVVSVLQDLGYIIGSADIETGFITAKSPTATSNEIARALLGQSENITTRVSAFVEDIADGRASIRLNFVSTREISGQYGDSVGDTPILDEKVYIEAFNKIENAIFIRS